MCPFLSVVTSLGPLPNLLLLDQLWTQSLVNVSALITLHHFALPETNFQGYGLQIPYALIMPHLCVVTQAVLHLILCVPPSPMELHHHMLKYWISFFGYSFTEIWLTYYMIHSSKHTVLWGLVYSLSCATITIISIRNFHHLEKKPCTLVITQLPIPSAVGSR